MRSLLYKACVFFSILLGQWILACSSDQKEISYDKLPAGAQAGTEVGSQIGEAGNQQGLPAESTGGGTPSGEVICQSPCTSTPLPGQQALPAEDPPIRAALTTWDQALENACNLHQNVADSAANILPACEAGSEPGLISYSSGTKTDRRQSQHADLNIWMRGMMCNGRDTALFFQDGPEDSNAVRIYTALSTGKSSTFMRAYSVYDWAWPSDQSARDAQGYKTALGSRGSLLQGGFQSSTAGGFKVTPGADVFVPSRPNGSIGDGYMVMVLYATPNQITLKYTREDNVIKGYTVHIAGVCVNQSIVNSFESNKESGKRPALKAGDKIGKSIGQELLFMIRDTGTFMNPFESNHWWD